MKYLLDTDIVIDHLRGKTKLQKLFLFENLSISIITYGELIYGAEKSNNKEKSKLLVEDFLQDLSIEIVTLDINIMQEFAVIKADLEIKGKRLDDFDLLIAATAKSGSFILVTRNKRHFQRIKGLQLFSG